MSPPNTDAIIQEIKKLDLQSLAREKGPYLVYPETKYPDLELFEHKDPGHRADPTKASILKNAEKVFDLTPHIGTEIHGLQLSALTDTQKDDLALLVAERGVVFFRDQDIDVYQGVEFIKHYGPPTAADGWHSDVTYENQPAGLTLLKIDTLPSAGGDTLWASGYSAYDRLSPLFQKFLEGLEAVHTGQQQVDEANRAGHVVRRSVWTATHPVIRTHPVTGWKALFVQPGFTSSIVGLSRRESDIILKHLFEHIAGGVDFQVRFKWQENSVAVWDNRSTVHNAIFDYLDIGKRHGWRVTPQAEAPYFDPKSKSRKQDLAEKAAAAQA
ncbi:hypothetical protein INT47_011990 [Mucor saturninus]|uniref:TauD/TfdA-like domain-containing protein n=1 Tax=Mucor saturninus TaxID=64648 RepID=A0A8H7R5A3_9FUNG|nr:hypothetical protein INT47_011990 [Mucor saturninus]